MTLDAWLVGVIAACCFGVLAVLLAFLSRRLRWPSRNGVAILLALVLIIVLVLTPPPIFLLVGTGALEITNPGHAATNFMLPYLLLSVGFIGLAVFVARHGHFQLS